MHRAPSFTLLRLAKRRSALRDLHEQFREGQVSKNYLALVVGDWQLGEQDIDARLYVEHRKKGEHHVVVSGAGKSAHRGDRYSRRRRVYWNVNRAGVGRPFSGRR